MDIFEPGATLCGGKYRLDRLVVAQDGVMVWQATDTHSGRCVQLSVFEQSSAMLDHGRIDSGTFVVFDTPVQRAPTLELVEVTEEDAFFDEPPAPELFDVPMSGPKRGWLWGGAVALGMVVGLGAFYVTRDRAPEVSETTITAAPVVAPTITTPAPPAPIPAAVVHEERHESPPPAASAPPPKPQPKKHPPPVHAAPRRPPPPPPAPPPSPPTTPSEPLTL